MDKLKVSIVEAVDDNDGVYVGAQLQINGVSFMDMVRQAELPMAQQEDSPGLAGCYGWCYGTRGFIAELMQRSNNSGQSVSLLQCSCGEPGCWLLDAHIDVGETTVTWRDFRQSRRESWDYTGLGPFHFDRSEYERELIDIYKALQ